MSALTRTVVLARAARPATRSYSSAVEPQANEWLAKRAAIKEHAYGELIFDPRPMMWPLFAYREAFS